MPASGSLWPVPIVLSADFQSSKPWTNKTCKTWPILNLLDWFILPIKDNGLAASNDIWAHRLNLLKKQVRRGAITRYFPKPNELVSVSIAYICTFLPLRFDKPIRKDINKAYDHALYCDFKYLYALKIYI